MLADNEIDLTYFLTSPHLIFLKVIQLFVVNPSKMEQGHGLILTLEYCLNNLDELAEL